MPLVTRIMNTTYVTNLNNAIRSLTTGIANINFEDIQSGLNEVKNAVLAFYNLYEIRGAEIVWCGIIVLLFYFIQRFLAGIGTYTAGALVNDKMALQANTSFVGALTKNLGKAALYNLIYASITFVYDILCIVIVYMLFFLLLSFLPILIKIFLFVTLIVVLTAIKLTFTCDWLPSLIYGKANNRQAIVRSFSRKGKRTANIFSNYLILTLIIVALNVAAIIFTLGAGFLITLPASYLLLISFQFINYCDDNGINYFTDKNTIVKQDKEQTITREQFFKGDK
jgi:hypothetical protein